MVSFFGNSPLLLVYESPAIGYILLVVLGGGGGGNSENFLKIGTN